ncbi:MAG: hypothetical protein WC414_03610 [Patescibacteria group bacterium]
MNILSLIASELNGREMAVLVWLLLFICYGVFQKNFRSSFLAVLKSFFQIKIIAVFVAMLFYVSLILWGLYIIKIWDLYLVKDTIFWLFGSAFILLLNSNKAIQNDNHFKNVLKDNIRLVIFLEFILTFYSFGFLVEMIFVPIMFIIVSMGILADIKTEYSQIKKIIGSFLSIITILLIVFFVYKVIDDYQSFLSLNNLRSFFIPLILSFLFMPFLYLFAVVMAYDDFFSRLKLFLRSDQIIYQYTKKQVIRLCFFNLSKLNKFSRKNSSELQKIKNKSDVENMIYQFKIEYSDRI